METYRTEEEQIDAIKNWWQTNGKSTVAGIVIALAAVFGWKGWQGHQQNEAADASIMFEQLLEADAIVQRNGSTTVTADTLAETVKSAYGSLSYGQFAALFKAKYAVMKGEYDQAAEELKWVLGKSPSAEIRAQTEMRLAQVYFAQSEYDSADKLLKGLMETGYAAEALELRGDILLEQGESDAALAAYQQARNALQQQQTPSKSPTLEMKINDLSTSAAADQGAV